MQTSQRGLLLRDIADDLIGTDDPSQVLRIVDLMGSHVLLDGINDADRIIRRIFTPVITTPKESATKWLVRVVEHRPEFFGKLPTEVKVELGSRLRAALLAVAPEPGAIVADLRRVSELCGIGLDSHDEDGSDEETGIAVADSAGESARINVATVIYF